MQAQDGTQFFKIGILLDLTWKLESTYPATNLAFGYIHAQSHDTILNGLWYDILYASVFEKKPTTLCPKLDWA